MSFKEAQSWLKKNTKEENNSKNPKFKSSPTHSSYSSASSREESSIDEFANHSAVRQRSTLSLSKKIISLPEISENETENTSYSQVGLDKTSQSTSRDNHSNITSSDSRKEDNLILKYLKSSTSPIVTRRGHKSDIERSPHEKPDEKTDEFEVKHAKSSPTFETHHHRHRKVLDKSPVDNKAKIMKFKASSSSDGHHRIKQDSEKNMHEKTREGLKNKINKFKTSLNSDSNKQKINDEKILVENPNTQVAKATKLKTSLSPERIDKIQDTENPIFTKNSDIGDVGILKLKSSESPERGADDTNAEIIVTIKVSDILDNSLKLGPDAAYKQEYLKQDTMEINIAQTQDVIETVNPKFKASHSPKLPTRESGRKLEKPIKISLVKSDDTISNQGYELEEQLKSSGSRSNLFDGKESAQRELYKSTAAPTKELSLAVEERMKLIEVLIKESTATGLSGESSPINTDHSSETFS